jgi:glycosyltransferase involved in cell wall biosynthesis
MRILHWYPNFLHGGAVAYATLGLAAAQARLGAHVVVAAATPSRRPLYEAVASQTGVQVLEWRPARTLEIAGQDVRLAPRRELAKLSALEPDIVHVHGAFNADNLRVSRVFRCPVVSSPHGAFHPVALARRRPVLKRIYLAAEDLLLRDHVRVFHVLSPAEAEHLAAVLPDVTTYCVPQGPSVLIPELVPRPAPMQTAREQILRFLFVGRLDVFTKGLDILLEAFEMTASLSAGTPMRLILAGPDWKGGRTWLEHRATELGIGDRVEFVGPLTGSQVGAVLTASDIYVQLSRHEGIPLSVIEALLAGKPAVLSREIGLVSYPEMASLPHIRVVPPCKEKSADAMMEVAQKMDELTSAACAWRGIVAKFLSWDRVAGLHLWQYARLLGDSSASPRWSHDRT